MIVYNVAVPIFTDEERVEFTVDTENAVITFICEWWDDLWHCSTTIDNGDKRSCVLYPNVLYYPQDRTYSFKIVTTKPIIGLTDLSGLELIVGVSETFGSAVSAGITSETVIDTPVEALFGSAAYRDVGSESAQIPLNSNLGSAAYKNVESIYLETNDPVAVDSMAIRDIRRYTKLTAYYSTGIVFSASGATFEGRASISLYGQYSTLEIERISATLFAIREWKDKFSFTPIALFSTTNVGITYTTQTGAYYRNKSLVQLSVNVSANKGTSTGVLTVGVATLVSNAIAQTVFASLGIGTGDLLKAIPATGAIALYKVPSGTVSSTDIAGDFTIRGTLTYTE